MSSFFTPPVYPGFLGSAKIKHLDGVTKWNLELTLLKIKGYKKYFMNKTKLEKIANFNPSSAVGKNDNLFGLPFNEGESEVVIVPVPWEVTVSYHAGTAGVPEKIKNASRQVDLYDLDVKDAWKMGVFMQPTSVEWQNKNSRYREYAVQLLNQYEEGQLISEKNLDEINQVCRELKDWVFIQTDLLLKQNKLVGILGGEHSVPLGFMEALAKKHGQFGIMQIDAHADLRESYEGFDFSHASIMYNALKIKELKKLVQVGIRDICEEEIRLINNSNHRVVTFFDKDIKSNLYEGNSWQNQCQSIINELPEKVYISFDIDGLDPKLCPHTGTPVAGGLEMEQSFFLIRKLVESGRKIIGFDLCEVATVSDDEWDANVGARVLFKLSNLMAKSNGIDLKI